jgi:hypothetical protein
MPVRDGLGVLRIVGAARYSTLGIDPTGINSGRLIIPVNGHINGVAIEYGVDRAARKLSILPVQEPAVDKPRPVGGSVDAGICLFQVDGWCDVVCLNQSHFSADVPLRACSERGAWKGQHEQY